MRTTSQSFFKKPHLRGHISHVNDKIGSHFGQAFMSYANK